MAQFNTSELKTAQATMRNPTGRAFDYNAYIYLGTDLAVVSEKAFHLEPGEEKQVSFPVTMPASPGIYPLHIGVFSNGENIALYRAEDVAIIAAPVIEAIPDVYGEGKIWHEEPGSGCSIDEFEINGVKLTFNHDTGKYEPVITLEQGQSCQIRMAASAWLTPKQGYLPLSGQAWFGVLITKPDGNQAVLGGNLYSVSGYYEANKNTFTDTWMWIADQIGIYKFLVYVRCVPFW